MYCLQPYVYYYISLFSEERYREAPLLFFSDQQILTPKPLNVSIRPVEKLQYIEEAGR